MTPPVPAGSSGDPPPPTPAATPAYPGDGPVAAECCEYCGAAALAWRKCKLICTACGNINKSCADL